MSPFNKFTSLLRFVFSEQLPDKTCHLPEPWHRTKTARETERHHQKTSGVVVWFVVKSSCLYCRHKWYTCSLVLSPLWSKHVKLSFQSIYHWALLQGSVTEDKTSSSHVVVPIPTSLEEGEVSISFKHAMYASLAWTERSNNNNFLFLVQRSGCVLWWREISKSCSTGDIFLTGVLMLS